MKGISQVGDISGCSGQMTPDLLTKSDLGTSDQRPLKTVEKDGKPQQLARWHAKVPFPHRTTPAPLRWCHQRPFLPFLTARCRPRRTMRPSGNPSTNCHRPRIPSPHDMGCRVIPCRHGGSAWDCCPRHAHRNGHY